ncbi:MAG: hypothetical protein NDJ75_05795, partial [Thermoanaerobaculia bacterium]|nr:hypothetical protein [Thermoanaerobaculia bacterium]
VAEFRRAAEAEVRRGSERALGALAELPAPTSAGWLAESDLSQLESAPRRDAARDALARLAGAVRTLDAARDQAAALDALLDGAHGWAERVALVLSRDSGLSVWGDRGFGDGSIAGRELDWDTTLRERLLATRGCVRLDADAAAEVLARFDAPAGGGALIVPLVLRDRVAALLWADGADEPELTALQLLVHAAGQRLELQALSERAYSPTLWDGADAPGAPLLLWSASPAPPEAVASAVETVDDSLWKQAAEPEPLPAPADEASVAEAPATTETAFELAPASYTELAESAREVGEALPPEVVLPVEPEPEPMPAFELENAESAVDDEAALWEPAEAEAPAESVEAEAPAEAWPSEPPAAPIAAAETTEAAAPPDLLGTVRLQLPAIDGLSRPIEETTAPLPIVAPEPPGPATTHEIPAPSLPPPDDAVSEDATVLSTRRPPLPVAPEPPMASTAAVEPPTWSSSPTAAPVAPPTAATEDPMDRTASRFGRSTEVAPPPDVSGPGLAFLAGRANRAAADPAHEEAKRLARLLISEIRLYNEEQVLEGRRHRDLYHRLKDDIDRSRQIFEERVDPAVRSSVDYFQQELVRSLAGGDPRALGI